MMKIAYFTNTRVGVSETFIVDTLEKFNRNPDMELTLCSAVDFSGTVVSSQGHSRVHSLVKIVYDRSFGRLFPKAAQALRAWLLSCSVSRRLEKKLQGNRPDVVYMDYATAAVAALPYLQKHKIPFVFHVHGYDVTRELNTPGYTGRLRRVFDASSAVISPSGHLKRLMVLQGCDAQKIAVINHAIKASLIEPLDWEEQKKLPPAVCFLGRLTPKKNPQALVMAFFQALEKVPDAHLHIVGGGPLEKEVKELIGRLGIGGKVTMYGAMPRDKAFEVMGKCHLYAQHSVTAASGDQEGFSVSIMEAAAFGLPVVSTLHNGITENVVDGVTGFLVQEYDYQKMGEVIVRLLLNMDLAQKMGQAGHVRSLDVFDPDKRFERICAVLDGALQSNVMQK